MPPSYNIQHYRGDTFNIQLKFISENIPEDLTGQSIIAQCRNGFSSVSKLMFTFEIDRIDIEGIVNISATPETTKSLRAGTYYWDIQIGDITRLCGEFEILPDISRI